MFSRCGADTDRIKAHPSPQGTTTVGEDYSGYFGQQCCVKNCGCRAANGRSHTSFLSPIPNSKRVIRFDGSRRRHCRLASNNSTQHL